MSTPAPRLYYPPWRRSVDVSWSELKDRVAEIDAGKYSPETGCGYQIVSISIAGEPAVERARFAAVFALRAAPFPRQVLSPPVTRDDLFDTLFVHADWDPALLSGVGNGRGQVLFALVLESAPRAPGTVVHQYFFDPMVQIDLQATSFWQEGLTPQRIEAPDTGEALPLSLAKGLARAKTLAGQSDLARTRNRRIRSATLYETEDGYRYAATWGPLPADNVHWGLSIFPEDRGGYPTDLDPVIAGMTKAGLRPTSWVVYPAHSSTWRKTVSPLDPSDLNSDRGPVDKPPSNVETRPGMVREGLRRYPLGAVIQWEDSSLGAGYTFGTGNRAWYDKAVAEEKEQGRYPISIQLTGREEKDGFYSVVFATTDIPEARVFRVRRLTDPAHPGPRAGDPFHRLDDRVQTLLRRCGGRAAQLAITRDGELVFSRTYQWAERWYPLPEHTTPFYWASVSKMLTAIGVIHRLGAAHLGDAVLAHIPAAKGTNAKTLLANLTINDALRHRGGLLKPRLPRFPKPWPLDNDAHLADLLASPDAIKPELIGTSVYENENFFLLGEVVGGDLQPPLGRTRYAEYMSALWRVDPWKVLRPALHDPQFAPGDAVPRHSLVPKVRVAVEIDPNWFDERVFTFPGLFRGAHGGWTMSAADLVRIIGSFDSPSPLLAGADAATMWDRGYVDGAGPGVYRERVEDVYIDGYTGGMPGVSSTCFRIRPTSVRATPPPSQAPGLHFNEQAFKSSWVVALALNSELSESPGTKPGGDSFAAKHREGLWELMYRIPDEAWPTTDQFPLVDQAWGPL